MKRGSHLAALVVLCLALVIGAACGGGDEEEEGVTQLKFGIGIPLTGALGAAIGVPAKYAFSIAAEKVGEFTVGGEQYRWKLYFEDNQNMSAAGGTSSAMKFIHEHHVDFMHQAGADSGLSAVSICEELGMILDTAGCDYGDFSPGKPHFFQSSATWSLHNPAFFHWLSQEHPEVHRVALSVQDDRTGHAVGDAIVAAAEHYGLEVVSKEYYPLGTVEMMPIATKIMTKDPDLFLGGTDIYDLMVAMGYEGLVGTYYWTDAGPEAVGWDRCEGYLLYLPHPIGDIWPEVIAFRVEYEDRYGVELTPAAFWAANVVYFLTGALEKAGTVTDMDKIIETMETDKFDTLVGPIGYGLEETNGIGHVAIYPTPIMQVVGENEYELIKMYTPEETEALAVEVFK